ncbi:hypothetical protein L1887_15438 [Cichorium endivia]|nr:hypothetical protein L1887_15438 [Cichorium endivia]
MHLFIMIRQGPKHACGCPYTCRMNADLLSTLVHATLPANEVQPALMNIDLLPRDGQSSSLLLSLLVRLLILGEDELYIRYYTLQVLTPIIESRLVRPKKDSDTCYAFWVGGVLRILGANKFIDESTLREFLLTCQSKYGGFSNNDILLFQLRHCTLKNLLNINILLFRSSEEIRNFQKLKAKKDAKGEKLSSEEIVQPRVPLSDCLNSFSSPEDVQGFYSRRCARTTDLTSFLDNYQVLHMRKFVMEAGWVPKKLEVYIDVDDIIDISHMRTKGLQPVEELLPEDGPRGHEEAVKVLANEDIVSQLAGMGFNHLRCQKAAINTSNVGVEEAMNWLLSHMDDLYIDAPINKESGNNGVDPSKIATLVFFGFEEEIAKKVLKALVVSNIQCRLEIYVLKLW